jgi:cobalt/nickel transport protein
MKWSMVLALVLVVLACSSAMAHFQTIYTPESALVEGQELTFKIVFTHPFEAGHTMDMGKPLEFGVFHKGKEKDLLKVLEPIVWKSLTNEGKAYEATYKTRGAGDFILYLVPTPYYEGSEDIYIQHVTKTIVNVGGMPTDWDAEVGLPVEIVPLDKPYALWTGNVFRGIVKCDGKPVPDAEIEVEYLNHDMLMKSNSFAKRAKVSAPQDAFVTMTIKGNKDGEFAFGIPKAGWWGFAALGAGGERTYKGKELSLDAVIWVQARDMK